MEQAERIDLPKIEWSWLPWRSRASNFGAEEERGGHRPRRCGREQGRVQQLQGDDRVAPDRHREVQHQRLRAGAVVARPAGSAGQAAPSAPPVRRAQHEAAGAWWSTRQRTKSAPGRRAGWTSWTCFGWWLGAGRGEAENASAEQRTKQG